LKVIARIISL